MTQAQEPNYETMSDEDFMKQVPAVLAAASPVEEEPAAPVERAGGLMEDNLPAPGGVEETPDPEEEAGAEGDPAKAASQDGAKPAAAEAAAGADPTKSSGDSHTTSQHTAKAAENPAAAAGAATGAEGAGDDPAAAEVVNYEDLYKQVMAPFRANGRDFTPSSPEEAVRLMQLGANYTKKMQALKPNLKMLRMLQNNDMLQEDKIAFLIDLDKKNPAAIQKLLHEGKVDPLDLDATAEPNYQAGNHSVSDEEMAFLDAIESVSTTSTGKDTIKHINDDWDQTSKQAVYKEPSLLEIIDHQRSNGIYDRISAEIDRRKVLGEFSNVPFIQAYKTVGDELHAQGKLTQESTQSVATPVPAVPVQPLALETRTSTKRKPTASREQVQALSAAPGTSPTSAKVAFNPFTMTDDEIMAMPAPR